jgi:hypothetical protein
MVNRKRKQMILFTIEEAFLWRNKAKHMKRHARKNLLAYILSMGDLRRSKK